jgi:nickel/cobalt exporter
MKRGGASVRHMLLALSLAAATILFPLAVSAVAHPLGNFSINHYSAIDARTDALFIGYIVDMAEVPTFQEISSLDKETMERHLADRVTEWARGLRLAADGTPVPLVPIAFRVACLSGAGGLPLLRIETDLQATLDTLTAVPPGVERDVRFVYRDANFADRVGWKEIVVTGHQVRNSTVSAVDHGSNRLRSYPEDLLKAPPAHVEAQFTLRVTEPRDGRPTTRPASIPTTFDLTRCLRSASGAAGTAGGPTDPRPQPRETTAFGALFRRLAEGQLDSRPFAIALLGAFVLGAYHAFTPGHGKTILAAYFIGSRGTPTQAVLLGAVTTFTHTSGVFLLGFAALFASRYVVPDKLYPWLGVLSGIMLLVVGVSLFRRRLAALGRGRPSHNHDHHDHDHDHEHSHDHTHGHSSDHEHDHAHGHTHLPAGEVRARDLITLGITGGLLPCPSALVVMLAALSVGQVGLGLVLITAFSVGLAAVLTAGGLLMVYAHSFMAGLIDQGQGGQAPSGWLPLLRPALQRLPVFSAAAVALLGLAIIVQTVVSTGLMK